ncbi:MAG: hypothetical protein AAGK04_02430 [Planctomycetota bacterium]
MRWRCIRALVAVGAVALVSSGSSGDAGVDAAPALSVVRGTMAEIGTAWARDALLAEWGYAEARAYAIGPEAWSRQGPSQGALDRASAAAGRLRLRALHLAARQRTGAERYMAALGGASDATPVLMEVVAAEAAAMGDRLAWSAEWYEAEASRLEASASMVSALRRAGDGWRVDGAEGVVFEWSAPDAAVLAFDDALVRHERAVARGARVLGRLRDVGGSAP